MIGVEEAAANQAATMTMCTLRVGDTLLAIEANRICEVLGEMPSKAVPLAPRYIDGVVAYRGEVLTTISLRMLLDLETMHTSCLVVLKDDEADECFGLAVDAVEGLMTIASDALEPNPSTLDARSMFLFDGLYRTASALVVRLNPKHLRPSRIAQVDLFDRSKSIINGWNE